MIVSNVIVGISAIVIFGAVIWAIIDEHSPNKWDDDTIGKKDNKNDKKKK